MESILIICDSGPFGSNSANEAIRLGSGFLGLGEDVDCKIILMGDAVLFMKNNLQSELIGMDSPDEGLEMADLTDMPIAIVKEDMEMRGLTKEQLIEYENLSLIDKADIPRIIEEYSTTFKI